MLNGAVLPDHEIKRLSRPIVPGLPTISDDEDEPTHAYRLIAPFHRKQLQPASYDIRLSRIIRVPHQTYFHPIDLRGRVREERTKEEDIEKGFLLSPGRFILGSSQEYINIPSWLVGHVDGKSGLARLGIQIHSAGFIDPGYHGTVTLEIVNFGLDPVTLWEGVLIAQIAFTKLTSPCEILYQGRHQGGDGPVGSRYDPKLEDDGS